MPMYRAGMESGPVIRARKSVSAGKALDIVLISVSGEGRVHPSTVHFSEEPATDSIPDQMSLSKEAAQTLMEDLWQAGFRPAKKPEPSALLQAKDRHIDHLFELAKLALGK